MRKTLLFAMSAALCAGAAWAENGHVDPDDTWMPPGVDWTAVTEVVVELQDNMFEPSDLTFLKGKPYKLVLRNVGNRPHDMVDETFFHNVVLRRVTTEAGSIITPHVHSLYIQPRRETVVYFVPIKELSSVFHCSLPGHREDGMEGAVVVE